ncbi:hypothetical protein BST61_g7312 [Cercospora zeina]
MFRGFSLALTLGFPTQTAIALLWLLGQQCARHRILSVLEISVRAFNRMRKRPNSALANLRDRVYEPPYHFADIESQQDYHIQTNSQQNQKQDLRKQRNYRST